MSPLVETLIRAHGDAKHAALIAEHDGHKGFAMALRQEADRLAAQARKAANK